MEKDTEMGHQITLSSGKVVLLREPRIEFQALAAQSIGGKAGEDKYLWCILLNKEMVRLMIHSIDGEKVSAKDTLNLDNLLSYKEFAQVNSIVTKLTGGDDPLELKVEMVPFGSK